MDKEKEVVLEKLKLSIERLPPFHHIEILRVLKKHNNITLNENRYGVYINLSFVPEDVLNELHNFVVYVAEQETQLEIIEKSMKITKKLTQEIMGELLTNKQLSITSLHGVAAFYHIHVIIVYPQKNTYINIVPEQTETTLILECKGKERYCIQETWTEDEVDRTYFRQDSYEKVLRGISCYKLHELVEIATKLRIDAPTTYKKEELYNKIIR